MYEIALCDDDEKELDQIVSLLEKYRGWKKKQDLRYKAERFNSAEALLWRVREEDYTPDILFLDIFMSGKTGVEAAQEMRRLGLSMPIIFLTSSTEHALNAYEVDALQYLVKPFDRERFFHALDSALHQIPKKDSQLVFKSGCGIRQIYIDEIIYCESQKNYQLLYLKAEECRVRITAGKLWEMLEGFSQFARCGRSYIMNMDHIISVEHARIAMDNGQCIYMPRNKTAEFKKVYFSYYFNGQDCLPKLEP